MMNIFSKTKNEQKDFLPIMQRIAEQDKEAAKQCIDVYGGLVWSLAKKSTNTMEDAETLVQKIFIDIWENAELYNFAHTTEDIWITMIAQRRLDKFANKIL